MNVVVVVAGPKWLLSAISSQSSKMLSACFIADMFLDHIRYSRYMACVRQTNENAGNLISMVQFLINQYLHVYVHVYIYLIDQVRSQDGWILAEFSFCVFMDQEEVDVHKNAKRERGQHPATLTELAWSIKDLLYGKKSTEKMIFVLVYFRALKRKPVICKSDNAFRFSCFLVPS